MLTPQQVNTTKKSLVGKLVPELQLFVAWQPYRKFDFTLNTNSKVSKDLIVWTVPDEHCLQQRNHIDKHTHAHREEGA